MRVTLAASAMALCAATACSSAQRDRLEGRDTTGFPTFRAFIDSGRVIEEGEPGSGVEDIQDGPRTRIGVDFSLTGADASFVPDGQTTEADYTMIEATIGARGGVILARQLTLELIGGFGYHYSDFEGPGDLGPISEIEHGVGPLVGTQVTWEPIEHLQLYGRATYLPMFTEAVSAQAEAGVQVNVVDEAGLLFAYRWWDYKTTHETGSDPEIGVDLEGIVFGMALQF